MLQLTQHGPPNVSLVSRQLRSLRVSIATIRRVILRVKPEQIKNILYTFYLYIIRYFLQCTVCSNDKLLTHF